jgi:hypothetical protein
MLSRGVLVPLVLSALGACGPRVHATRTPRGTPTTSGTIASTESSPQPTTTSTGTASPTATNATTTPPTATVPTTPTTAPTPTTPPAIADDLVSACRANCDALRNACAAGDPTGCYALCDEYDRTLARTCRTPMATYFRCLSWTASCEGGQPRSDTAKCGALRQALEECRSQ